MPKASIAIGWNVSFGSSARWLATPRSTVPSATSARTCGERWSVALIRTFG